MALENRGLICWYFLPQRQAGPRITRNRSVQAIRAAKIMVLVSTANANNSDEIKKEARALLTKYNPDRHSGSDRGCDAE